MYERTLFSLLKCREARVLPSATSRSRKALKRSNGSWRQVFALRTERGTWERGSEWGGGSSARKTCALCSQSRMCSTGRSPLVSWKATRLAGVSSRSLHSLLASAATRAQCILLHAITQFPLVQANSTSILVLNMSIQCEQRADVNVHSLYRSNTGEYKYA